MPIIKSFKSTTIWKAFILNAFAASLIIVLAIWLKSYFQVLKDKDGNVINNSMTFKSVGLLFAITFISSIMAYIFLWILTGYGGGMLVDK